MELELKCFSKSYREIIEKRIEFFMINLKCFKKVHRYKREFSNRDTMIKKYGIENYVRLMFLMGEPLQ